MKVYKEIKRVAGLINLIVISLFVGCSNPTEPNISPLTFELDARLDEDINGFYHLTIDKDYLSNKSELSVINENSKILNKL